MARAHKYSRTHRISIVIVLLIILIAGFVTVHSIRQYYATLSDELFLERQTNMTEYGTKSAQMA